MTTIPTPRPASGDPAPRTALVDPVHWSEVLVELHAWAGHALGLTGSEGVDDVPAFGSPAWCALDADDPRRAHAIARAALAWWQDQQTAADQTAAEHVETSHALSAALDWRAVAADLGERPGRIERRAPDAATA